MIEKVFVYIIKKPLSFIGLMFLLGVPTILAFIDGAIELDIPEWFYGFSFFLALVLMHFGQKYESRKNKDK